MIGGNTGTVKRARNLRQDMALPERLLWRSLKGDPDGIRFRRQHAAGRYILDFYCAKADMAVEIDGIRHSMGDRALSDDIRDNWLAARGIETIRIPAGDVLKNPESVADGLVRLAKARIAANAK